MRRASLALMLAACSADPSATPSGAGAPVASLACGMLSYHVDARRVRACGSEMRDERDTALDFTGAIEVGAEVDGALAQLRASCSPERLTASFTATAEAACDTGCRGSNSAARPRWTGVLRLPLSSPRWRVRFVIDAARGFARTPEAPRGECVVTLPASWRAPIVVDAEHIERELVVPAGDAAIGVACEPLVGRVCFGATDEIAARFEREGPLAASLAVRVDARPESE